MRPLSTEELNQLPAADVQNELDHLDAIAALRGFVWAAIAAVAFWIAVALYVLTLFL